MTRRCHGLLFAAVALFAGVHANLLSGDSLSPVDPLSPLDFKLELDDLGTPKFDSELKRADRLGARGTPFDQHLHTKRYGSGQPYWYESIPRVGFPAYGRNATYKVWRNVKDYGAVGDGVTDDTVAIQNAVNDGNRCGAYTGGYEGCSTPNYYGICGCDSQTTTPAIVYFPAGTYLLTTQVVQLYYTHFVGDANNLPVMKAASNFEGAGLFDTDPYIIFNDQWYQNQNNFWRQIKNFVFDTTAVPIEKDMHALHYQVSQGASLQNVVINMPTDPDCKHVGIYMENGSSQFFEDVIINGGFQGYWAGNQQLNVRNLTLNNCRTGIYQGWGWAWNYNGITFNNCDIGVEMISGGSRPTYNNIIFGDSVWNNCGIGLVTNFNASTMPTSAGGLILDHCRFVDTPIVLAQVNGTTIVDGCGAPDCQGTREIELFVQGNTWSIYDALTMESDEQCYGAQASGARVQQEWPAASRPVKSPSLLDENGNFRARSRPQYEGVPLANFRSIVRDGGCPNDGLTDATQCVQDFLDSLAANPGLVGFVDHGAYIITDTVNVPTDIRLIGEIWPYFMVTGPNFQDESNPRVAFRVGQPGDVGTTEIVEIMFQTRGPTPGAIITEWNLECTGPATCGMWDTHWRIGGTNGTELQNYNCIKRPNRAHGANPACFCAFLLLHVTSSTRNMLMSHNWGWVSDHELDREGKEQIDIYNGRGYLIESQGPLWMWGSSSEHSMLYNYQFANAANIYIGLLQSETAYMQTNPNSISAFKPNATWNDPTFDWCFVQRCYKTIAVRVFNSTFIYSYGAGLYSFFENYDSACIATQNCDQERMVIDQSEGVYFYGYTNVAAEWFANVGTSLLVSALDNEAFFGAAVAVLQYP
ncbi:pectin lyase-like protein [Hortaea werneckii]|uniref:Rhamnogalacturonase A/B/Epimerase-like pectate lyase domain-containing protein n=1 Tax=Hortaea werneckii TaxID=91943 RepID=A0A3M7FQC1_HORWE|nr:pectin lyase-like protein [Hortaea werneckii]RMY90993.1 hypothetical protein D0861_03316 [Hortaea werneckii]